MRRQARLELRPGVEGVEERRLTTVGVGGAVAGLHAAARGNGPAHAEIAASRFHGHGHGHLRGHFRAHLRFGRPGAAPVDFVPIVLVGGVGSGNGSSVARLPANYLDWGVVTLWNNTSSTVTFSVSASTYNGGRFSPFQLPSGGSQSYFAPVVSGNKPVFRVSFFADNSNPITLQFENTVFAPTTYNPPSTAGFPYAINAGLTTPYITQI